MTPLSYNTWVSTMTPICIKDNTLVLQVKDPSTKNTLKSIYTQTLTDCINRANSGTYLVRFIDESELPLYNAYREDKPELVAALQQMSAQGLYPTDRLF